MSLGTPAQILRTAGFSFDTGHVPYQVRTTQWFGKLDQYIGNRQRLSVRVNGASELNENIEPFGGLVARSRAAVLDTTDVMGAVSHNFIVTPQLVNEARFLVAWRDQTVSALDPACDGFCDREDEGGPTIEVSGTASLGRQRFTPTPRDNIRYQFVDTLSYSRGQHLFKVGADVSIVQGLDQALPLHFGGRYIFTGFQPNASGSGTSLTDPVSCAWRPARLRAGLRRLGFGLRLSRHGALCGRRMADSPASGFAGRRALRAAVLSARDVSESPACRLHTNGRAMAITSRRGLA